MAKNMVAVMNRQMRNSKF